MNCEFPSRLFLLLFSAASCGFAADPLQPTFSSDIEAPAASTVSPLLRVVCGEGLRTQDVTGKSVFGGGDASMEEILASRDRPRRYGWMPYALWQADGFLFGHFLSATSEDALISGGGAEGHPDLWGGTLLLTRMMGGKYSSARRRTEAWGTPFTASIP
jgi:hypothetical protein